MEYKCFLPCLSAPELLSSILHALTHRSTDSKPLPVSLKHPIFENGSQVLVFSLYVKPFHQLAQLRDWIAFVNESSLSGGPLHPFSRDAENHY